jgi:hypothetical protein
VEVLADIASSGCLASIYSNIQIAIEITYRRTLVISVARLLILLRITTMTE